MKNRKATKQQIAEDRNALYNKVMKHNKDLAEKNCNLSQRIQGLENNRKYLEDKIAYLTRKRWWQFWK